MATSQLIELKLGQALRVCSHLGKLEIGGSATVVWPATLGSNIVREKNNTLKLIIKAKLAKFTLSSLT